MKSYDRLMEELRFREDFCEATLQQAEKTPPNKKSLSRKLALAACMCLCTIALLGTTLAGTPTLRSLLIPNYTMGPVESPELPTVPNIKLEKKIGNLTMSYYKLDGAIEAGSGFGSALPIRTKGILKYYCLNEEGNLEVARAPKVVQKEFTYKNKTWSFDWKIYRGGDVPVLDNSQYSYPMDYGLDTVLGRWEDGINKIIWVNTETWEIDDPLEKVEFTPDEDAIRTRTANVKGSPYVLIQSEFEGDIEHTYCANAETGEVHYLGESNFGDDPSAENFFHQYFPRGNFIYRFEPDNTRVSNYHGVLYKIDENYNKVPMFGGQSCHYTHGDFASIPVGKDLKVINLKTEEEYLFENCAEDSSNADISANPSGTVLCFSIYNPSQAHGLGTKSISLVDTHSGIMYSLERLPGMHESMAGWFDDTHYLIAGTIDDEWYICLYELG